jgi:hypothetical protein
MGNDNNNGLKLYVSILEQLSDDKMDKLAENLAYLKKEVIGYIENLVTEECENLKEEGTTITKNDRKCKIFFNQQLLIHNKWKVINAITIWHNDLSSLEFYQASSDNQTTIVYIQNLSLDELLKILRTLRLVAIERRCKTIVDTTKFEKIMEKEEIINVLEFEKLKLKDTETKDNLILLIERFCLNKLAATQTEQTNPEKEVTGFVNLLKIDLGYKFYKSIVIDKSATNGKSHSYVEYEASHGTNDIFLHTLQSNDLIELLEALLKL